MYKIKWLKERAIHNCTKYRNWLFAFASKCWDKVKVCRKTRTDVEKGSDGLTDRESVKTDSNQKAVESDLNKMAFVDDKHIENFETLAKRAKSLEFKLEDRTRELADLILNNNKNNSPEDRINNFEPRVEDRTKTLEDKLENRTKTLEDKLNLVLNNNIQNENRTKTLEDKLNTILEHIKSNKL